ncbi:MAG: ABC transporter permease, partial [Mesorhizobium sp.]
TASTSDARSRPVQIWLVVWACALAAVLAVFLLQDRLAWAVNYPAGAIVPVADWVSALMNLIKSNFSWLTRSITAALGVP